MTEQVGRTSARRSRLAVGAVVGAVLALTAAACGGATTASNAHRSPRQAVLASVSGTESASSAAIGVSVSVEGTPSLGGLSSGSAGGTHVAITVTGQGLYSFAQKTGEFTLVVPSLGKGTQSTVKIEEIGDELYLSNPRIASIDGDKPWVKVNVRSFEQSQGQSGNPAGALSDGDPTQILGLLQQLGTSVTEVGPAQVDGVATTEYQGQIDLTGNGSTTSPTLIPGNLAHALGLSDIPVDVWVDSAGRARQIATSFSVVGLQVSARATFGSFGTPVSVSAPPASQVADGSSLLQSGQLNSLFA